MVAFVYLRSLALLARQLERRLEEIDIEPGALVQALERAGRSQPAQPPVSGQTSFFCSTQA